VTEIIQLVRALGASAAAHAQSAVAHNDQHWRLRRQSRRGGVERFEQRSRLQAPPASAATRLSASISSASTGAIRLAHAYGDSQANGQRRYADNDGGEDQNVRQRIGINHAIDAELRDIGRVQRRSRAPLLRARYPPSARSPPCRRRPC
jgi:hypothetical protein